MTKPVSPAELDKVIHERARLAIVAALAAADSMTFTELKDAAGMTDGNLSVHARVLEGAGYVEITKRFVNLKPQTSMALTAPGREAFRRYLDQLQSIVEQGRRPR